MTLQSKSSFSGTLIFSLGLSNLLNSVGDWVAPGADLFRVKVGRLQILLFGAKKSKCGRDQWSLGLGFDGLLQKAGPDLGLSMGLDKPITKCGNCEREPRESNISR